MINGSEVVVEENTCPIIDNETLIKMVDNGGVVSMLENCDLYMGTWMKDEEYLIYSDQSTQWDLSWCGL